MYHNDIDITFDNEPPVIIRDAEMEELTHWGILPWAVSAILWALIVGVGYGVKLLIQ